MLDRLDDVHVARAPAEVARDAPADLVLAGLRVLLEEGVAGHEHARGAVAALEPVLGHEAFLEGMELAVLLGPLHGHDLPAVGLHREYRAGLHGPAVQEDGARAAVGRVAADVRAREPEDLSDQVHEEETRLDVRLELLAVDGHLDLHDPHLPWPARSRAFRMARPASTRTRSRLYSTEPRRSAAGSAASAANCAACLITASSRRLPLRAASARVALMGTGPTLVSPIPAASQAPPASRVSWAATAAVAKSPTFLSILT